MNNWLVLLLHTFTSINTSAFAFQSLIHFHYIDDTRWRDNLRTTAYVYSLPFLSELVLSWSYTGISEYSYSNIFLILILLTCIPCWYFQKSMYDEPDINEQHSYIKAAEEKNYRVLLLDSPIISHLIQKLETKKEKTSFVRVDGDSIENLIKKDENIVSKLSDKEKEKLKPFIEKVVPSEKYTVKLESMDSKAMPFVLIQPEFMRRMKEMQQTGGGMMGSLPEMHTLLVNTNHTLVGQILNTKTPKKRENLINQALDLAKLSQNLLKGEELTEFIKRSLKMVK